MSTFLLETEYRQWLLQRKQKVQQARLKAAASSNAILISLCWELGKEIVVRENQFKWGWQFPGTTIIRFKTVFSRNHRVFPKKSLYDSPVVLVFLG